MTVQLLVQCAAFDNGCVVLAPACSALGAPAAPMTRAVPDRRVWDFVVEMN
jgi:hypothetical protein